MLCFVGGEKRLRGENRRQTPERHQDSLKLRKLCLIFKTFKIQSKKSESGQSAGCTGVAHLRGPGFLCSIW